MNDVKIVVEIQNNRLYWVTANCPCDVVCINHDLGFVQKVKNVAVSLSFVREFFETARVVGSICDSMDKDLRAGKDVLLDKFTCFCHRLKR